MKDIIEIGTIVSTRGLDGTLKINSSFSKNDFIDLKTCFVENEEYKVKFLSGKSGFLFVKLEQVEDVNIAQSLKNKKIFVKRKNISLKNGEYLVDDLINMQVFTDENLFLGYLCDIENFGSKDIYTVKNSKKEYVFCLIDGLIENVDYENNKMILNSKILSEVIVWR